MRKVILLLSIVILSVSACKEEKNDPTDVINFLSKEAGQVYLQEKFEEINTLSTGVTCVDGKEWETLPIGSKACGGPSAFVAYHPGKHGADFLKKVTEFTAAQKAFNIKWGVFSDCSLVNKPTRVDCIDGKPVMVR